jgi:mRNA interferase RelE/StbE
MRQCGIASSVPSTRWLTTPRPPNSKQLDVSGEEALACEVRRLRINNWRVADLITEEEKAVDVVAVRKRPPYDYGDLAELLGRQP